MKEIQLKWGITIGSHSHLLIVRRKGGLVTDTLTLDLDSKQLFSVPVGGAAGNESHYSFRVEGREFSLAWKWSKLTGDPEYIVLRGSGEILYSYGLTQRAGEGTAPLMSSQETQRLEQTYRRIHSAFLFPQVAILLLVVLAFITNPSHELHKAAIREKVANVSPMASALGVGLVEAWITEYHSVGVASFTVFNGRVVSFGAFGMVKVSEEIGK